MRKEFRKKITRQWLVLAVVLALIGGAVAHNIYKMYQDLLQGEQQRLLTQSRVVATTLEGQFDAAQRIIKLLCADLHGRSTAEWAAVVPEKRIALLVQAMPAFRVLNLLGADGRVQLSNLPALVGIDLSQRDYFLHARNHHNTNALFLSAPFKTKLNVWGMNLVQVIKGPDNQFGGIVTVTVNPDYFSSFLGAVNYNDDMLTAIVHGEGMVYVTAPLREHISGKNLNSPGTLFTKHRDSGRPENSFSATLHATNDERMVVFRTFQPEHLQLDKPLYILTSRSLAAITADWRSHARYQVMTFVGISLLSGLVLLVYQRRLRRQVLEAELVDAHLRKLTMGVENSANGVLITDLHGTIEYVNRKFSQITGYSAPEAIGRKPSILKSEVTPREVFEELWATILRGDEWHGELMNRRKNGEVYWSFSSISPLRNEEGVITHFIANVEDINERKNAEATIQHLAYFDPLTDLPNRRMLQDRLSQALKRSRRQDAGMALLYIDLDSFKHVNDSLGHPAGDALLRNLSRRLVAALRDDDVVCRLGGDEFAVILHDIHHDEDVVPVANKLLRAIEKPVELEEGEVLVSASIGIALFPKDGTDSKTLEKNADLALYHAKEQGKNTFRFFSEELNRSLQERIALDQGLRYVLERNELELHYQPKVALASGTVTGVEALVRWNSPEFGLVSPLRFIPLAEENRQIIPIGEWVLRTACLQQVAWLRQGMPLIMAVNLSAVQFKSSELIERIATIIADTGIDPAYLELELTESALVDNPDEVVRVLERLRGLGCGISIDDFGTGYSSLSYLKNFPVTILKIDRSFVRDLTQNSGDQAIARSVVDLASNLQMQTVAEGVETAEQLTILQEIGCTFIQGYYYSRPLPADQLPETVRSLTGKSVPADPPQTT